jgi:hypothetical protein
MPEPRYRVPTEQQQLFAQLHAVTGLSLVDCFRVAYPKRKLKRREETEWRGAVRMLRAPGVITALEKLRLNDPEQMRRESLIALNRIAQGELDARLSRAAAAQLKEANRIIERRAALERSAEHELERRREQEARRREREARRRAWRMFYRAAGAVYRMRHNGRPPLSPAERTRIIFEHFAPLALPEPLPPPPADVQMSELREHIHVQQQALEAERTPVPEDPVEMKPEPGCFPHPMVPEANDSIATVPTGRPVAPPPAGEWQLIPIAGRFPPRYRRVWKPAEPAQEPGGEP